MKHAKHSIAALFLISVISCYGPKQAKKQVDRAILEQPGTAAAELRKAFPCTQLAKTDTTVILTDSVVYVDCPQDYAPVTPDTTITVVNNIKVDSMTRFGTTRIVKVPVHLPVKTQVVTKYIHDNTDDAIIKDLAGRLEAMTLQDAKHKGSSDKWFWIAMGELAIIGIGIFLKLKSANLKSLFKR